MSYNQSANQKESIESLINALAASKLASEKAKMAAEASEFVEEASFRFKVDDVRDLEEFHSRSYFVRGQEWFFRVSKKEAEQNREPSPAVVLVTKFRDDSKKYAIVSSATLELVSSKMPWKNQGRIECVFRPVSPIWGFQNFMPWDLFLNPELGYVNNNMCEFKVKLSTSPLHDVTKNDLMKMETIESCCDHCSNGKFRFTIHQFRDFIGSCSPEITLCGVSWLIVFFKTSKYLDENEELKDNYLRIQLQYRGDVKSPYRATMTCKLVPSNGFGNPVDKKNKNMVFNVRSEHHNMDMVSWQTLSETKNGFVKDGTFVIEIKLHIEKVNAQTETKKMGVNRKLVELECSICFEDMIVRHPSILRCGHMFCKTCIVQSLKRRQFCPLCNKYAQLNQLISVILPTK